MTSKNSIEGFTPQRVKLYVFIYLETHNIVSGSRNEFNSWEPKAWNSQQSKQLDVEGLGLEGASRNGQVMRGQKKFNSAEKIFFFKNNNDLEPWQLIGSFSTHGHSVIAPICSCSSKLMYKLERTYKEKKNTSIS